MAPAAKRRRLSPKSLLNAEKDPISASYETPKSAQEALLDLERSTGPPRTQLEEAARIIGTDFRQIQTWLTQTGTADKPIVACETFAPKEEWVLRLLQKKLKISGDKLTEKNTLRYPIAS